MTNNHDRVILIRTWSYHARLRSMGRVADYDSESAPIPVALANRMPRAAMVPGTYAFYKRAQVFGLDGHHP